MTRSETLRSRGLTLLEAVLSIVITAIIAATIAPVIGASTESYATATISRRYSDQAAYAMERIVRLLREMPLDEEDDQRLGVSSAGPGRLLLSDGRGLELNGDSLFLIEADGLMGLLCESVSAFEIEFLNADGTASVAADSELAHVAHVRLVAHGFELRTRAFPRVKLVAGG